MNKRENLNRIGKIAGAACAIMMTVLPGACLASGRANRAGQSDNISESQEITAQAQKRTGSQKAKLLTFDSTVHNFGDITNEDGPQTCVFKYSNQTDTTILIYDIKTTCECTKAEWSRKPIRQGESGEIKVTYANEGAPHHFDKGVEVYTSTWARPILLRIQGTVKEK